MNEGWHADPLGRHELRYHDGQRWTEHVADAGQVASDPLDGSTSFPQRWPAPSGGVPNAGAGSATTPPIGGVPTSPPPGGSSTTVGGGDDSSPTRSGWSTGAKIGAALGVLALVVVSGVVGFVLGAASDVGSTIAGGLDDFGVAAPEDATESGAVLSSDQPVFSGTVDGTTSFTVRVARAGTVGLEIEQADFDTYIYLYDADGMLVDEDDDDGEGIFLSRIEAELQPGEYTLVLDAFGTASIPPGSPIRIEGSFTG